ncbi:hypothetical protein ElyMa_001217400 [Elysia marginata]|uniref:Uncharacterized protein n=1 Tax=Elysia marginata TaxID=1093978 RepID=A0AAV4IAL1_9GAST|nr:hypothetical protein ElyMa_001217400 [Elysia marginata]
MMITIVIVTMIMLKDRDKKDSIYVKWETNRNLTHPMTPVLGQSISNIIVVVVVVVVVVVAVVVVVVVVAVVVVVVVA